MTSKTIPLFWTRVENTNRQNKKRDLIKFLEYKRIDSHIIITIC